MFDNIGAKIKKLAKIVTIIGIVLAVITGIIVMFGGGKIEFAARNAGNTYFSNQLPNGFTFASFIAGILTIGLGSLAAWVSSFLLYGFGTLVENSDIIAANTSAAQPARNASAAEPLTPKPSVSKSWVCKDCHTENNGDRIFCSDCGKAK